MTHLFTRQDMVDAMAQDGGADVTERIGHDWKHINAMVADQGDATMTDVALDFHMLELYLEGCHQSRFDTEFLTGPTWRGLRVPGSLAYHQNDASIDFQAEGDARILQIYLDKSIFADCATNMFKGDPDNTASLGFLGVHNPKLKYLAEAMLEEARRPAIGTDLNADLIAQQMALLILREQNVQRVKEVTTHVLSEAETARVISYLQDQIEDIGGMDTVAGLINMDVYAFTRAFKATTGQTPGQFLIEHRVARVKDLLLHTNDTLADITYATGFSNQPHMTSTFSKHVGTSPGKWRASLKS